MTQSTFMGVKKREKKKPDLTHLFTHSSDYGSWSILEESEKNDFSCKKKKSKKKKKKKTSGTEVLYDFGVQTKRKDGTIL